LHNGAAREDSATIHSTMYAIITEVLISLPYSFITLSIIIVIIIIIIIIININVITVKLL